MFYYYWNNCSLKGILRVNQEGENEHILIPVLLPLVWVSILAITWNMDEYLYK